MSYLGLSHKKHYAALLLTGMSLLIFFLLTPNVVSANCSCSVGSNGIYVLGYEFIAKACPSDPPSDDTSYIYLVYPVNCMGGTITKYTSYGDIQGSPNSLLTFYTSKGYRVLKNPSGTHIIAVQNGNYPFTGHVSGVQIGNSPAGLYATTNPDSMNQFCTPVSSLADEDGDGFPDCLDCAYLDPTQGYNCTPHCDSKCIEQNLGPKLCPVPGLVGR